MEYITRHMCKKRERRTCVPFWTHILAGTTPIAEYWVEENANTSGISL